MYIYAVSKTSTHLDSNELVVVIRTLRHVFFATELPVPSEGVFD